MNLDTITFVLVASIPFFIGTVWAVVDASQKDFGGIQKKVLWVLVSSIPYVGFLLYLVMGFRLGKKPA